MDDLGKLGRRAMGGDLAAARRLVAALESRAGGASKGGGIWIRAWERVRRTESEWGWANFLDLNVQSLEYGPFSAITFDNSTKGVMQVLADGRMIAWQPTNNPGTLWRVDAAAASELALVRPEPRAFEVPGGPVDLSFVGRRERPAYVMRRMEFTDSRPA